MKITESGPFFDPSESETARIVSVGTAPFNAQGAVRMYGRAVVFNPEGAGEAAEVEIEFSCAPWNGYLHDYLSGMAGDPSQYYAGFHLQSQEKTGPKGTRIYHNLVGLHEIEQPEDWDDQCARMGLQSRPPAPPANGRAALRPTAALAAAPRAAQAPAHDEGF